MSSQQGEGGGALLEPLLLVVLNSFGLWLPVHISAFQEAIRSRLNYFWKLGNVAESQQEGSLLELHPEWLGELGWAEAREAQGGSRGAGGSGGTLRR